MHITGLYSKNTHFHIRLKAIMFHGFIDLISFECRLDDNYVEAKDQCLPRSTLYMHYQDFCKKNAIDPVSQASFGKVSQIHL